MRSQVDLKPLAQGPKNGRQLVHTGVAHGRLHPVAPARTGTSSRAGVPLAGVPPVVSIVARSGHSGRGISAEFGGALANGFQG